jgi:hypothetical protein
VTNGLFTTMIDFGPVVSNSPTWLAISVRSNNVGIYTNLTPLQELTPTPYAIYAESAGFATGLANGVAVGMGEGSVIDPSATDSFIGGGDGNNIGAGSTTGTIAGGSQNHAVGQYVTVGGGNANQATNYDATVSGGYDNVAGGYGATVAGGGDNTAIGQNATVGGGYQNNASGYMATISGGTGNNQRWHWQQRHRPVHERGWRIRQHCQRSIWDNRRRREQHGQRRGRLHWGRRI